MFSLICSFLVAQLHSVSFFVDIILYSSKLEHGFPSGFPSILPSLLPSLLPPPLSHPHLTNVSN